MSNVMRLSKRNAILIAASPLIVALNLSVSQVAMAACGPSAAAPGITLDCSGDVSIDTAVSNTSGAAVNPQAAIRLTDVADLTNNSTISSTVLFGQLTAANVGFGVYGIWGQAGDPPVFPNAATEFTINNSEGSTIGVSNAGRGLTAGIYAQGDVEAFTVNNAGTISIIRGPQDVVTNAGGTVTVRPTGSAFAAGPLGIAAGIYNNEEEVELETINNLQTGLIQASGLLTAAIYSRANALVIVNEGTIKNTTGNGSAAIATYDGRIQTDGPEGASPATQRIVTYGKTFLDNYGTITGDIQVVEQANNQYMASILGGYDLSTADQTNRRDSEILNDRTITGNIYLGAGSHVLTNTENGTITGNILVDQRRGITAPTPTALPFSISVATRPEAGGDDDDDAAAPGYTSYADFVAANPDHHFELDNAGVLTGNVTVLTYAGPNTNSRPPSTIELRPHITGSGSGSTLLNPSENSGFIEGTLAIGTGTPLVGVTTSTIAATTTLAPVIDHGVHDGDWFLVARTLFGSGLPTVEEDSFLVDWTAAKNANNALVIGAEVADASVVTGLSKPGIATLNNLMQYDGDDDNVAGLAAAIQSLSDEGDVRKTGKQLAPETNFATQQQALTLSFLAGQNIDNRLASVGAAGTPAASFAPPSGLGMSQKETPSGRMSLGAYDDETVPAARERGGMWGQGIGSNLQQDEKAGVDGYDAKIYGALAGIDNWVTPGLRLGVAVGYARSTIDGDGDTSLNSTDVDSYMALGYAAVKGAGWYVSGRAGYTLHQYDTTRVLTVPINDTATASHDGDQYTVGAEFGAPMRILGSTLTPVASLTYNNLQQDGYTESGGGMAFRIGDQDTQSLSSGLGVKALIPIARDTLLEGRAIWLHEFEDTNQEVTANFSGGSPFAVAGPDVGRDTAALGAGLLAYTTPGVTFQINYDALVRDEFVAHAGSGRVRVEY